MFKGSLNTKISVECEVGWLCNERMFESYDVYNYEHTTLFDQ